MTNSAALTPLFTTLLTLTTGAALSGTLLGCDASTNDAEGTTKKDPKALVERQVDNQTLPKLSIRVPETLATNDKGYEVEWSTKAASSPKVRVSTMKRTNNGEDLEPKIRSGYCDTDAGHVVADLVREGKRSSSLCVSKSPAWTKHTVTDELDERTLIFCIASQQGDAVDLDQLRAICNSLEFEGP